MGLSPGQHRLLVIWQTSCGQQHAPSYHVYALLPLSTPQVRSDSGAISTTTKAPPSSTSRRVKSRARLRPRKAIAAVGKRARTLHVSLPPPSGPVILPASHPLLVWPHYTTLQTRAAAAHATLHSSRLTSHDYHSPMIIPRDKLRRRNITPAL